jgi:hypothetical protein
MFTSPNSAVPATQFNTGSAVAVCSPPSAEILDASGRGNPFLTLNSFGRYQKHRDIRNHELGYQSHGANVWLDGNALLALQSDAIRIDVNNFIMPLVTLAELNRCHEVLSEQLDAIAPLVVYEGSVDAAGFFSGPDGEWTYRLEDAVSVLFPYAASGALATFESVYHSGELVYQSCIEYASFIFEQARSLVQQLRYIGSLIVTWFRSRRGLPDTFGLFLSERSWYLHHSAHPPAASIKAEGRFAATMRRVCFRPLPA